MANSYEELFNRNIGFVTSTEQQTLRNTPVFVAGVGGMGGACLMSLVRAGFEKIGVADIDVFETSNINRQLFSDSDTIGKLKTQASIEKIKKINPSAQVEDFGSDWLDKLDDILKKFSIVVNGTDDIASTISLYRKAQEHRATVVDAYTSPLPSVYVTRPTDPRPETRLKFRTSGKEPKSLSASDIEHIKEREAVYVMINSSSRHHIDPKLAGEMVAGKRARMSFAPMVITTGNLMCYQVVALALDKPHANHKGFFLDAYTGKVEKPKGFLMSAILEVLAKQFLKQIKS